MDESSLLEMIGVAQIRSSRLLFKNLNLRMERGECALLTGANGSGKTTLLRLAAGLSRPVQGIISRHPNLRPAYLGHATFLYPGLTALENLSFWNRTQSDKIPESHLEKTLEMVELLPFANEQTRKFSRGMSQRLNFARILLAKPQLFLLDEPFTGLDRHSRDLILDELKKRKKEGAAILMVSHEPEADGILADKFYLLARRSLLSAESAKGLQALSEKAV